MKKRKTAILTLSLFFMSTFTLQASMIVTPGISETDFDDAFSNDRVWYAQFQPGGPGASHPENEFEIGGDTLRYYEGNTSIVDESNNPFEVTVSSTAFLTAELNSVGTPGGSAYGVTKKFNTVWIGLKSRFSYGINETLDVINHEVITSGMAILPNMQVTATQTEPNWVAFKFYVDDRLDNIGNITISGNILPDMRYGGSINEDWTYTVFATHDPSIIPESSTTLGTPHSWYIERGVTEDFETYDTTDFNNDGFTGHQKFLMGVDDLFDDADHFRSISLSMTNGITSIVIPHSKTNRRYRIESTPSLAPTEWTSSTNALGTGGTLILELPDEADDAIYYRGSVELP